MSSFHPNFTSSTTSSAFPSSFLHRPFSDPDRLAPEDAFSAHSPPRRQRENAAFVRPTTSKAGTENASSRSGGYRERHDKDRGRSRSRRQKGVWKKLLWVKQSYPDNYTDPPTFLSHLQFNPRLVPYDFWPLVADSTVIVQHICSVAIFVCCFVGIIQERVSPVSVVGWGTAGTVFGWVLWDFWLGQEEAIKAPTEALPTRTNEINAADGPSSTNSAFSTLNPTPYSQSRESLVPDLGLTLTTTNLPLRTGHSHSHSQTSIPSASSAPSPIQSYHLNATPNLSKHSVPTPYYSPNSTLSPRNQQRLATAKSAILIYCALLALSPILKSLTKSTTSDSIWAMSCWLMCINIFFFDYGGGVGVKFPASLSTNAALMASTVLASRLPSTTHVFSLTLFSIEVFGLFPVFRRHLRHMSWRAHLLLTLALVVGAGAGMGIALTGQSANGGVAGSGSSSSSFNVNHNIETQPSWNPPNWKAAGVGVCLWGIGTAIGMGGCSWWLIGLQRYKNVVIGPWDPARPVIRQGGGGWE